MIFESQSKKKVVDVRVDIGSLKGNQQDPPQSKTGVAAVTAAGGDTRESDARQQGKAIHDRTAAVPRSRHRAPSEHIPLAKGKEPGRRAVIMPIRRGIAAS